MHRKTVTILLRIRARGDFVISITKTHESHYVGVLDNPRTRVCRKLRREPYFIKRTLWTRLKQWLEPV